MAISEPTTSPAERGLPWYVAVLHGLGGVITGALLIGFLMVTLLEDLEPTSYGVAGAVLIATATAVAWLREHPFLRLFALSLSFAGHGALGYFLYEDFDLDGLVAGLVLLSAGLYVVYRDPLHRFLSVLGTLAATAAWILGGDTLPPNAVHGLLLLVAAGTVWCFCAPMPRPARPAGYAAAVMLLVLPLLILAPRDSVDIEWWAARAVAAAGGLCVLWLLGRAYPAFRGAWLGATAVGVVAVGAVTTPGLALAASVLTIGFWRGERILTALGLLFLPVFLVVFYYDLEVTLLDKSLILMAGGAVLLVLRQGLILWDERRRAEEGAG